MFFPEASRAVPAPGRAPLLQGQTETVHSPTYVSEPEHVHMCTAQGVWIIALYLAISETADFGSKVL